MNAKEQLTEIRKQIDEIDGKLLPLFEKRMELAEKVAMIKRDNGMQVFDGERERQVIKRASENARKDLSDEVSRFMRELMSISSDRQRKLLALSNIQDKK